MTDIQPTSRTTVRRLRERAVYDRAAIDAVLDEAFICHAACQDDGSVWMIPTAYGRDGDRLLLHGAAANHVLKAAATGAELTVTVTLTDGLVLARSTFHHSINYRSVTVFGTATDIADPDEKAAALELIVDHILPGRSGEARSPTPIELAATRVVSLPISEASAKMRAGGPKDDEEDLALDVWAGVLPLRLVAGAPEPDADYPRRHPCRRRSYWPGRPDGRREARDGGRMAKRIGPGVVEIDTLLGGWERVTAGYLIEGPAPVLVETGSQSSVPALLDALAELGIGPGDLAGVAVTHIHLDHAGGVGDVARAFPEATVYVHEKGARHLVDPERLVRSAAMVYGDLLDSLYGRLDPTPAERVHVLADGEQIDIGGGRTLTSIDSPGHAKHHLALHDSSSGILFAGDALGVRLPDVGVLRPATPPADFDLDQAVHSMHRFADRRPTGLALAHYGLLDDTDQLLAEAEDELRRWAGIAERAWRAGEDIAAALTREVGGSLDHVDGENRSRMETLNGIHSNAAGLKRWLETTQGS